MLFHSFIFCLKFQRNSLSLNFSIDPSQMPQDQHGTKVTLLEVSIYLELILKKVEEILKISTTDCVHGHSVESIF